MVTRTAQGFTGRYEGISNPPGHRLRPVALTLVLDLARAYDAMWRDGGWLRLLEVGVHGKMWRMVRATYRDSHHHVRVNGHLSDSFTTDIGVRQGAVLSPLLFSLFLAGVVREWRRAGLGVRIGKRRVAGLLFADDIVLVASSMAELQRGLAMMDDHARRWRYQFNQSKCAVVTMMARKPTGVRCQLQGQPLPETLSYKYLGITMETGHTWKKWSDERLLKAKQSAVQLYHCGARSGALAVRTAERIVQMLQWPVLTYGSEVASVAKGETEQAERLQAQAARYILGTPANTPLDMARGELGWMSVGGMRDMQALRYINRLQRMRAGTLAKDVFEQRLSDAVSGQLGAKRKSQFGPCYAAKLIFQRYGLAACFQLHTRMKKRAWGKRCARAVLQKESAEWEARLASKSEGSRPFYRSVKMKWGKENYLLMHDTSRTQVLGRKWKANMRCSTAPLNARAHHLDARADPVCAQCALGEHEDQRHIMCTCTLYSDKRASLFVRMQAIWLDGRAAQRAWWRRESVQWADMSDEQRTRWLLSTSVPDACRAVNYFLAVAFSRRPDPKRRS